MEQFPWSSLGILFYPNLIATSADFYHTKVAIVVTVKFKHFCVHMFPPGVAAHTFVLRRCLSFAQRVRTYRHSRRCSGSRGHRRSRVFEPRPMYQQPQVFEPRNLGRGSRWQRKQLPTARAMPIHAEGCVRTAESRKKYVLLNLDHPDIEGLARRSKTTSLNLDQADQRREGHSRQKVLKSTSC